MSYLSLISLRDMPTIDVYISLPPDWFPLHRSFERHRDEPG